MISPPMMSSGRNASPSAKRRPITSIALLLSAMMANGSVPLSSMRLTSVTASSIRIPTIASVNACDMHPPRFASSTGAQ